MKRWDWNTIGGCCELTSGGTPSKHNPQFWKGDIPFVSARDLKTDRIETAFLHISPEAVERSATKLAPVGSLLMLVRGMGLANGIQVGEVVAPVAFNQDIRAIHPPSTVLSRFLLLALRSSFLNGEAKRVLSSAAHGTLKIDTDALKQIGIPVPPLPEQRRIVGILDAAFDGIAVAKANTEKNLQNAHALFESCLEKIFSYPGDSWSEKKLEEVVHAKCSLSYGIVQPGEEQADGLPIVRPTDLSEKVIRLAGLKRIDPALASAYKRTTLVGDELLLCVRGSTGAVAVASKELDGGNVTRGIVPIRFDPATIQQEFGYYLFLSGATQKQIKAGTYGAALMQINIRDLRNLLVRFPSLDEQLKLVARFDDLSAETQRLTSIYERKLAALDELKKSLLHQAFTGQL